jgi:hypothetical protein
MKVEITAPRDSPSLINALAAYAWPIVIPLGLVLFRKSTAASFEIISRRSKEIGVGLASIKLPEARQPSLCRSTWLKRSKPTRGQ